MNSSIFVLLVRDIRKAQSTDKIVQMCLVKWAHYKIYKIEPAAKNFLSINLSRPRSPKVYT